MDTSLLKKPAKIYSENARFCGHDPETSYLHTIYDLKQEMDTCNYLEIGSLFGYSMVHSILSTTPGLSIGIDLFENPDNLHVPINDYSKDIKDRNLSLHTATSLVSQCNINNSHFKFLQGNSRDKTTMEKLLKICNNFDILYIDGDHSEAGVLNDFNIFTPLLNKSGYLILDDHHYGGIHKLVQQIKSNPSYKWIDTPQYGRRFTGYAQKL